MKSDSSDKSESCCDDSDDEVKDHVPVISSTSTTDDEPAYEHIEENIYLIDKKKHINKEVRKMTCECEPDDDEPCGEDCLNRLLMIECNHRCPCGDECTNKRFQQGCKVKIEVFKTEKKGWGVKTLEDLGKNQFVMEYCGEVMNYRDFQKRAQQYDRQKRRHYYFMTLRADEIIDATFKGSLSRFVNHSCDPNCVTQKWTVNGLLRIGFFTLSDIRAGEELTFDYQLQRYGKVAQTCYCKALNCRGTIGGEKHTPLKNAFEKIATPSISSPRRNRRKTGRSLETDFDDMSIEEELERLIGDHCGLTHSDQALKLSRLMVRAETTPQRIMLLKVLQNTTDQNCLKAFLRFQGLLLLWSWMVDAGSNHAVKLRLELLATLKYLPVTTKNQLEDSKVIRIVNKWALKDMAEHEMPSSCSSQEETLDDIDRTQEEYAIDRTTKKKTSIPSSPSSSTKGIGEDDSTDRKQADKSPCELSEDDTKSTEDEHSLMSEEDGDVQIGCQAYELLQKWSTLKEVYRIPKKSSKQAEVVVATSSTEPPAAKVIEQDQSVVVSQPDSSGNIEDNQRERVSFTPPPLMSVEVPVKSQADPSNIQSNEWKSISSTSQDTSQGHAISTISHDESRHQVFGYKQKMGNGEGGSFNPSPGKSKKFSKKTKWKQNVPQPFPSSQVGPQSMPGIGYANNFNNPQAQNWQGASQQWQKGPPDTHQGPPFFGQQFGPSNMVPCNAPPPNLSVAPNFHLPPPNFPPPGQPFASPSCPPPQLQANIPRFTTNPQQNIFPPNFPPSQIPFQPYTTSSQFNVPKPDDSKRLYQNIKDTSPLKQSSSTRRSPVKPKTLSIDLPANWKTATDPQGNIYYYHTVTRKTQWELPREEGHDMDIETPSDEEPAYKKKKPRTPKTPPGTPPRSPLTFTTAAADTTQNKGMTSLSPSPTSHNPEGQKQKMKDSFRMKLSNVVVNCLNPYYKVDCKQGRITNADDFKYLARKLTHGIMNKELHHVKSEDGLQCNDSVKVKTKEYIRNYMRKYDHVYKR